MSEQRTERQVPPGEDGRLEAAWRLKERIHRREGVLAQRRNFFVTQYRRSTDYLETVDGGLVGFAVVRSDGYLSMLGVDPDHRREGVGRRLVARAAADFDRVTCHTRASNDAAVAFYTELGFAVDRRVDNYYRDGDDALLLALAADGDTVVDRLTDLLE